MPMTPADKVKRLRSIVVDLHKLLEAFKAHMDSVFLKVILVVDIIAHATLKKLKTDDPILERFKNL